MIVFATDTYMYPVEVLDSNLHGLVCGLQLCGFHHTIPSESSF